MDERLLPLSQADHKLSICPVQTRDPLPNITTPPGTVTEPVHSISNRRSTGSHMHGTQSADEGKWILKADKGINGSSNSEALN